MNRSAINSRRVPVFLLALLSAVTVIAQTRAKPWEEWSRKDADKMLTDSPWAQTQVDTDISEMFYKPTTDSRTTRNAPGAGSRLEQGATNEEIYVKYRIRFFSARPVRQAHVRMIEINQRGIGRETAARLRIFAELAAKDLIILTVTYESNDKRYSGKALQLFGSTNTGSLKNNTYLERNDGRRLFLDEYSPPGRDGFGARFIFRRFDDGVPFITAEAGEIRFFSEISKDLKLNMKFRVADMVYDGKLEY
jgi:hypothetical protein